MAQMVRVRAAAVPHIRPGLYRLHWKAGGSSLAAVGVLSGGALWFAPVNGTFEKAEDVARTTDADWERVARTERIEVNS